MCSVRRNLFLINYVKFFLSHRHYNKVFVPKHEPCSEHNVLKLQQFVEKHKSIFVLTGAGISTESGLPDYRSKDVGLYDRSPNRPIQYKDFISSEHSRKRYWARNFAGWKRFSSAKPNETHYTLANWETKSLLSWLVTQNVDRLHHKAGSKRVVELHGTSYLVKCLNCPSMISRHLLQLEFAKLNPDFPLDSALIRPDADAEIDEAVIESFKVPACYNCGGCLKPNVIFFGENVQKETVFDIYNKIKESDAVLAIGTSLEVFSGYRFLLVAHESKKRIAIINIGKTRADHLADLKINARCGEIIPRITV